jgi:hypothetical protein
MIVGRAEMTATANDTRAWFFMVLIQSRMRVAWGLRKESRDEARTFDWRVGVGAVVDGDVRPCANLRQTGMDRAADARRTAGPARRLDQRNLTPLERPASMAGKAFLTEAEAAAIEKRTAENRSATDKFGPLDLGSYNRFWYDDGTKVLATRQTSLVVDPPDGRCP